MTELLLLLLWGIIQGGIIRPARDKDTTSRPTASQAIVILRPGEQYNYSGGYGYNNNNNNGYYNYMLYPNTTTTTTPTTTTTRLPYGNYYVFNFRDGSQNNTGDAIYADPSNDGFTFGSR